MDIITVAPVELEAELDAIAAQYRAANRAGIRVLNALGDSAETLLDRLPGGLRAGLDLASEQALWAAVEAADRSRRAVPDQKRWINTALATAMGAAGGAGGIPGALVELPATTTMLLRAIQGAARAEGFDPTAENVKFDCIQVFAAAGPFEDDDGADLGFLSVRLSLTGPAMNRVISAVVPRLSVVLGQKLAAASVPVLGALAGATTNYVYAQYYQQIAHVQFGLRRLAIDADRPREDLIEMLRARMLSAQ
ncbi:MAG: EcsC family protein [Marinibacterium sp.]|nr:EcsC family protein [Marinibacterium sp.]